MSEKGMMYALALVATFMAGVVLAEQHDWERFAVFSLIAIISMIRSHSL